jgi:hypothetical protein
MFPLLSSDKPCRWFISNPDIYQGIAGNLRYCARLSYLAASGHFSIEKSSNPFMAKP